MTIDYCMIFDQLHRKFYALFFSYNFFFAQWLLFDLICFIGIFGYFQSISEFLKNLPCHNEKNFALFNTENGIRTSSRRPSVYLPTVDIPSEQSKCDNCNSAWWALPKYSPLQLMRVKRKKKNTYWFCLWISSNCDRKEKHFTQIFAPTMGQKGKRINCVLSSANGKTISIHSWTGIWTCAWFSIDRVVISS